MKQQQNAEYSVYVFHHPLPQRDSVRAWERKGQTANRDEALQQAEGLHQSRAYHSIEVKKKFFDMRRQRIVNRTVKIYHNGASALQPAAIIAGCATGLLFILAVLAAVLIP